MKILLLHVSNTYNYGSMMMAENLITYLNKISNEDIDFFVDNYKEEEINRLREATEYKKIFSDEKSKLIVTGNKVIKVIKKALRTKRHNNEIGKNYDYIFFLGGDDFSEIYTCNIKDKVYMTLTLIGLRWLNKRKNVMLIGQTIGPFTGLRKQIAKNVFSKIRIITRDDVNYNLMKKEYNAENIEKSRDLAFLDLNLQGEYMKKHKEILNKYNLTENEYVTIVGTGISNCYTKNEEKFIKSFIEIIKNVKLKFPDKKIVWLSHVTTDKPARSDNTMLDKLRKYEESYINNNVVVINKKLLPVEARIILGYGYMTITCRMHAAVSTFQMGKPAICLSYSPKYEGVITDGLQMKNLVIESKGYKIWENNIIVKEILDKIEYVENNYENIQKEIIHNVKICQKMVLSTIQNAIR